MQFSQNQINEFWLQHARFLKTPLVTETPNPLSYNLSELCQTDLKAAFAIFKEIELAAIKKLLKYTEEIKQLQDAISTTLNKQNKIFLLGCGASGRLAMLLKRLWELYNPNLDTQIVCVAAAGDVSLIKSVEQFEDHPEFGVKQLLLQGYSNNDLVIGLSAGGESPFILGGIAHASNTSCYKPYLICNNPVAILLLRNAEHIASNLDKINVLALDVGPMALTGSTRLQATTAMQIALGLALCSNNLDIAIQIEQIYQVIKQVPLEALANTTQIEADILTREEYILYTTNDSLLGLSLLADITERSPTFNLPPFENITDTRITPNSQLDYSPFYLSLSDVTSVTDVWETLLGQAPTCLNWQNFPETTVKYINGFDLSSKSNRVSGTYLPQIQHLALWQTQTGQPTTKKPLMHVAGNNTFLKSLSLQLNNIVCQIELPDDLLQQTLIYKLCLNSHSTLMMGRLGYFEGNLMLSLKPSNFKLIDRTIRYSKFILATKHKLDIDYKIIANAVFEQIPSLLANQSIVNNVVNSLLQTNTSHLN